MKQQKVQRTVICSYVERGKVPNELGDLTNAVSQQMLPDFLLPVVKCEKRAKLLNNKEAGLDCFEMFLVSLDGNQC